MRCYNFILYL